MVTPRGGWELMMSFEVIPFCTPVLERSVLSGVMRVDAFMCTIHLLLYLINIY